MAIFSHHAHLISEDYTTLKDTLFELLGDAEIIEIVEPTLYVDRARNIIDLQLMKTRASKKALVIAFDTATPEAQNALLKVLEEPVPSTYFFLVTPNPHKLLPTLRSRLNSFQLLASSFQTTPEAKTFLSHSPQKRLESVGDLIENKDRQGTARLLKHIVRHLQDKRESFGDIATWGTHMKELDTLLGYAEDPASSPKMILEHLCLSLPQIQ